MSHDACWQEKARKMDCAHPGSESSLRDGRRTALVGRLGTVFYVEIASIHGHRDA